MKILRQSCPGRWKIDSSCTNLLRDLAKISLMELIESSVKRMSAREMTTLDE